MKQYHLVKYIFDGVCHGTVPWQAAFSQYSRNSDLKPGTAKFIYK